jgi:Inorganic pyrophosphatase
VPVFRQIACAFTYTFFRVFYSLFVDHNYTDIYPHMLKEITHFFSIYKDLEGKRVEIKGWHDAAYARDQVVHSATQFEENKARLAAQKLARSRCTGSELYGNNRGPQSRVLRIGNSTSGIIRLETERWPSG